MSIVLSLCACAAPLEVPFDSSAASYVFNQGNNSITGRAYLVSRSGYVRTCIYRRVELIPVTTYSTAWMSHVFQGVDAGYASRTIIDGMPNDDDFAKFRRQATCDQSGSFTFKDVADGKYYVFAGIYWALRWQRNGGGLMKEVDVTNGKQVDVVLMKTF
jgi:hypothetical protein